MSISLKKIVSDFNASEKTRLLEGKKIENFRSGDTVSIEYKQVNQTKSAFFEGTVIKSTKKEHTSSITVAKMSSHGVQIVRTFNICNPIFIGLKVVRKATKYRRARLYYKILKQSKV